jgi:prepilin-type N-terminal cleavage/methylation domain-containing protein
VLRRRPPARPAGFTLVELLVVVTIIVLLLALLLPAIQKVRTIAQETEARNDISQIALAADNFKNDWGEYPPSVFTVPGNKNSNDPSFQLLARKYPRWAMNIAEGGPTGLPAAGTPLVGNQSMVYFLGGPAGTGWAHDQPVAPNVNATSKMVYLEINSNKLQPGNQYGYASPASVYMDPFGTPYAYFGSNKVGGKYPPVPPAGFTSTHPDFGPNGTPMPYQDGAKFANENKCQIISAGPNNRFGAGGAAWTTTHPDYVGSGPGGDDLANFNNGNRLGVK